MNKTERAELEARLAAITPGEWEVELNQRWRGINIDEPRLSIIKRMSTTMGEAVALVFLGSPPQYENAEADIRFVMHAPSDLRTLLDALDGATRAWNAAQAHVEALLARVAALEDALHDLDIWRSDEGDAPTPPARE